jgi:threonine/homoserine/homoserine lactone efflux protein
LTLAPLTTPWLIAVLAFAFAMSATPGPNTAMVTASGATFGFRRTLPHMAGIAIGFPAMIIVVATGAGELLKDRAWLHGALKWIGAAYLVWLAGRIATATPDAGNGSTASRPLTFLEAALVQWLNPKAWTIVLGAIVTYTSGPSSQLLIEVAVIAATFGLVLLPVSAFWTLVGVGVAQFLRTTRSRRVFNTLMATLLLASIIPMLLATS